MMTNEEKKALKKLIYMLTLLEDNCTETECDKCKYYNDNLCHLVRQDYTMINLDKLIKEIDWYGLMDFEFKEEKK